MRILIVVIASMLLNACSWGTFDRREKYLDAGTIDRVSVPAPLDEPVFEDAMVIPEVQDVRQISGQKMEVGLPEPLSTSFGVEQIVIKRLGDIRWVYVDTAPATVWPTIRQYFDDYRIPLVQVDPRRGVMESDWLVSGDGTPEEVLSALKGEVGAPARGASMRHKFRVRIEPGIRTGSTEVYLEHKSLRLDDLVSTGVVFDGASDDSELEGALLSNLAFYLGERINRSRSFSMLASNIAGQRAELIPDRHQPVLKYKLPFDRAWATVGIALENARVSVEDLDRSSAIYYVYYDPSREGEPGFFSRLFTGDEAEKERAEEFRYEVHLDRRDDEVSVTVLKGGDALADALVAERLLRLIKEYST